MSFKVLVLLLPFVVCSYEISVVSLTSEPVVSYVDLTSSFEQVFNPSFILQSKSFNESGLIIRTQNCTAIVGGSCVYCSGNGSAASILTYLQCNISNGICKNNNNKALNENNVIFSPISKSDMYGTEDPRVIYNKFDNYYYMTYTSYGIKSNNKTLAVLSLAKSKTPNNYSSWIRLGPIFSDNIWSKSGAILLNETYSNGTSFLYWGDSNIRILNSTNISNWNYGQNGGQIFLSPRKNSFDSLLVESGPPPIKLSDNNYIFFYNSANNGFPNDPNTGYHPGYVIINKTNPYNILQRSNNPLLYPNLDWEIGESPYTCNVPRVVFLEAAYLMNQNNKNIFIKNYFKKHKILLSNDSDYIRIYFGGSDAVVGTAVVQIQF